MWAIDGNTVIRIAITRFARLNIILYQTTIEAAAVQPFFQASSSSPYCRSDAQAHTQLLITFYSLCWFIAQLKTTYKHSAHKPSSMSVREHKNEEVDEERERDLCA